MGDSSDKVDQSGLVDGSKRQVIGDVAHVVPNSTRGTNLASEPSGQASLVYSTETLQISQTGRFSLPAGFARPMATPKSRQPLATTKTAPKGQITIQSPAGYSIAATVRSFNMTERMPKLSMNKPRNHLEAFVLRPHFETSGDRIIWSTKVEPVHLDTTALQAHLMQPEYSLMDSLRQLLPYQLNVLQARATTRQGQLVFVQHGAPSDMPTPMGTFQIQSVFFIIRAAWHLDEDTPQISDPAARDMSRDSLLQPRPDLASSHLLTSNSAGTTSGVFVTSGAPLFDQHEATRFNMLDSAVMPHHMSSLFAQPIPAQNSVFSKQPTPAEPVGMASGNTQPALQNMEEGIAAAASSSAVQGLRTDCPAKQAE